ncbi:hypothetical protein QFC21_003294 [Naganishia friedmannii]|uniref:Uncharacterized protein n=1 Tax=Naganishia friedmannii TaxID=89922 RepID=A0ACC2VPN7_9TREE|nr:hypothetical protein QFC21_003294 [Naganishia friedmannii]
MTNPEDCLRSPYIIAMSDILSAIASTTESTPEPAGTHVTTPARYRRRPIQSLTPVQKKSSAASSVAISPQSTPPSSTAGHRSESPNSTTSFDSSVSGSAREEEDPRKHTGASTTSMRDHGSVKLPSKRTVTFDSSAKEQPGSPGSSIHTRYEQAHPQGSGLQQLKQPPDSTWNLSSGETRAEAPSGVSSSALQIYLAQVAQHIKTSQLQAAMLRNAQAALGDMDSRVVRATHEAAARQAENSQLIMEVEQLRSLMRTLLEENDKRRSQTTNQPGTTQQSTDNRKKRPFPQLAALTNSAKAL